ncbi:MAG: phosphotransferase [Bdellovibrionota bacterium]|nr:MAG: phosphotransferase [Bdellovibrionota bacterium]
MTEPLSSMTVVQRVLSLSMHTPLSGTPARQLLDSATRDTSISIVERATGLPVTGLEPIVGRGMSADVIVANTSEGRFVVRLKNADWLAHFRKEAWCLEQAHSGGVPVPRVIDYGVENTRAFSLARFVEGAHPIGTDCDRLRVWERLGHYAKILNQIPVRGFGSHMVAEGVFSLSTLQEMLEPEINIVFRDAIWEQQGILSKAQTAALRRSLEDCYTIKGRSGVCQWDMCCENALMRGANPDDVVLLDLDQTVSVIVPAHQLAYVAKAWGLDSAIMQAFLRGYGMSQGDFAEVLPLVKRLLVLQSMRSVRWAEDRSRNWLEKNLAKAHSDIVSYFGSELAPV